MVSERGRGKIAHSARKNTLTYFSSDNEIKVRPERSDSTIQGSL